MCVCVCVCVCRGGVRVKVRVDIDDIQSLKQRLPVEILKIPRHYTEERKNKVGSMYQLALRCYIVGKTHIIIILTLCPMCQAVFSPVYRPVSVHITVCPTPSRHFNRDSYAACTLNGRRAGRLLPLVFCRIYNPT